MKRRLFLIGAAASPIAASLPARAEEAPKMFNYWRHLNAELIASTYNVHPKPANS